MVVWLVVALALSLFAPTISGSVPASDRACSSLVVKSDKDTYTIGESVGITVTFLPLLPGCVEPMIAHDYVIQIQVLNASNQTAYTSTNVTSGPLTIHEAWTPTATGGYTIIASAFFRLLGDESMVKSLEASTTINVHDPTQPTPGFEFVAIGVVGLAAVTLTLFFLKRRKGSSRKAP